MEEFVQNNIDFTLGINNVLMLSHRFEWIKSVEKERDIWPGKWIFKCFCNFQSVKSESVKGSNIPEFQKFFARLVGLIK